MARLPATPSWSYVDQSRGSVAPAESSEIPSASVSNDNLFSSLFPMSMAFQTQTGRPSLIATGAAEPAVPGRNPRDFCPSVVMPGCSAEAFSLPLPPRRTYLQPSAATTDGRAAAFHDACAFSTSQEVYDGDQACRRMDTSAAISDAASTFCGPVGAAQLTPSVVERRMQTQRPLHRAHPYGSSLLGRLINKISSSLSSLVPRASAGVSSGGDTPAADSLPAKPTAEAPPHQLLYSRALQQPVYDSSFPSDVTLNTYSVRRVAAPAEPHVGSAVPAAPFPAKFAVLGKHTQRPCEGTAVVENKDEQFWLAEQQLIRPYGYTSYQTHAAVDRETAAARGDSRRLFPEQALSSSLSYEQQLQQEELRLRQQLRPRQQQGHDEAEEEEARRGAGSGGVERGTFRKQQRQAATYDVWEGGEGQPYSLSSLSGAVPARRSAVITEEKARERREAGAVETLRCPYYDLPRQPVLAESCFDSLAADSAAVEDDVYGSVAFRVPSAVQQHKQQRQGGLLSRGADDAGVAPAEAELQENYLSYVDSGGSVFPRGILRSRVSDRTGELLPSTEEVPASLVTERQPYLKPKQVVQQQGPSSSRYLPQNTSGARTSPVRRDCLRSSENQQQQEGPENGATLFSGLQEETGSGVSLSRTSSNSHFFPAAEEEGVSQVRRPRPLQRGWGGASSSLFSQSVAPTWLSTSADADLPDADGRRRRRGSTGGSAAEAATAGAGLPSAARPFRRREESTRAGAAAAARRSFNSTGGMFPYPHQEQLTVEQLQKLYLRCQPLRWRVRLRDLLRQEAAVAAAEEKKTRARLLKEREAADAAGSSSAVPAAAEEEDIDGATEKEGGGVEAKEKAGDSSRMQTAGGDHTESTAEGRGSAAAEASRSKHWNAENAATSTSEERRDRGVPYAGAAGKSGGSLFHSSGDLVQQATVSTAQARKDISQGEKEKSKEQHAEHALKSVSGAVQRSGSGSVGLHEQESSRMICRGGSNTEAISPVSLIDAAGSSIDENDGSKRSKVSSDKSATEGSVGVHRSLFASGSSNAGGGSEGVTPLFGSSSRGLFGSAPVAAGNSELAKPEGGAQAGERLSSSSSQGSTVEERGVSLFGQKVFPTEGRVLGSLPPSLFGSSNSALAGLTGATQQVQQQGSGSSSSGKTGVVSSSSIGGATPASSLFGGTRSSSSAPQQQVQQPVAAELVGGSLSQADQKSTQAAKEQTLGKEAAGGPSTTQRDATAAEVRGTAAEKPAGETSALPWWQQNLNKPCSVMPEEDFAPEADDEEEGEEKTGSDREKGPPPLKVPNIFGSSSSTGGLFGAAGASVPSTSLFKDAAAASSQPSVSSSTSGASALAAAGSSAPSVFGSAGSGTGLWNQSSSSSTGTSLFGGLAKPSAAAPGATLVPPGSLFGGRDSNKPSSSQLSNSGAPTSLFGGSGGSSGTAGEPQQPTSLSGSITAGSNVFATQKASASLFGGSIFGNPVASSQTPSTSQQAAGTSVAPAAGAGLFVFGASGGASAPSVTTATALPAGQTQKGSGDTTAVPTLFGSLPEQQAHQASSGAGKRGRDTTDGGSAAAVPAGKSLFGSAPASATGTSGGGLGLFGQRIPTGGSALFGGVTPGSSSTLFNTNSSTATGTLAGQTDGNVAGVGSTGLAGSGSLLGDKGNNSSASGSLFGATRSATPVFGNNSSSTSNKDAESTSMSTTSGGSGNKASATTGNSVGLFGSSSNNNPFGFGGSSGSGGVSLFGSNAAKPLDSTRPATTEGSFTSAQPLWSAEKGSGATQGLFSVPSNTIGGSGAGMRRTDAGATTGGTPNGVLQPQRSLFGGFFAGSASSGSGPPGTGNTTNMQGGLSAAPNSLFGNVPGAPPSFTFGAGPATATPQQQQTPSIPGASGAPGGAEGGNGGNAFFGAPSSGVRRPRLTIKRTKQ